MTVQPYKVLKQHTGTTKPVFYHVVNMGTFISDSQMQKLNFLSKNMHTALPILNQTTPFLSDIRFCFMSQSQQTLGTQ